MPPQSQWPRQWNSSKRSCTRLACPRILSWIIGLSSLRESLGTFVQTWASMLTMPLCHTYCVNNLCKGLAYRIFWGRPFENHGVKELPSVLWALCSTPSHSMGHTPFSLVYGSEAILPIELEHKSFRVQDFNEEQSDDSSVADLTRLEELRKATFI
jgi:hypothetical protein